MSDERLILSDETPMAELWPRFWAYAIDCSLCTALSFLLSFFLSSSKDGLASAGDILAAILMASMPLGCVVAQLLYFTICECLPWQATIGKKLMRIRVTDTSGKRITFFRSLGRNVAKLLFLPFFFWVAILTPAFFFNNRKQAFYDMFTGTLVIKGDAEDEQIRRFMKETAPRDTKVLARDRRTLEISDADQTGDERREQS